MDPGIGCHATVESNDRNNATRGFGPRGRWRTIGTKIAAVITALNEKPGSYRKGA
jgi:hypothetical protein